MDNKSYYTALPLDIGQLNKITAGKHEFKEELLEMFFLNIAECLILMEKAANDNIWERAAAELRDTSKSLGALELSRLCSVAQTISHESRDEKKKILANIQSNIQKLRIFVRNTRY